MLPQTGGLTDLIPKKFNRVENSFSSFEISIDQIWYNNHFMYVTINKNV